MSVSLLPQGGRPQVTPKDGLKTLGKPVVAFFSFSGHEMYRRMVSSSNPAVLTQYLRGQK
jgi:hypothetical protein